jgi:isopentenyl diphosphate isomerase/L-lactate dehydrogenase-like FMN-dependent dehydrogenase
MDQATLRRRAHSVAALRLIARRRLPRMVFDFVDGGAEEERTLRANEDAFGDVELCPRPLDGTAERPQAVELLGLRPRLAVGIGPTGLAGMLWPEGEIASARAAAAAGTLYVASHGSTVPLERIAREAPGGPKWMQVFMYRDRGLTRLFAERAEAAGYDGLVLTTDNQVLGQRERDLRNGFTIPPRPTARNALDLALTAPWLWRMRRHRDLRFANYPGEKTDILSLGAHMAQLLDPGASWADVAWLRGVWKGPLILKGVLHPDEARRAAEEGVDAVIVSNHGGRQLDGVPAAVRALPRVVDAAAGRMPVLIDGGVRRGADVVKALALGAAFCLVGRPQLWGLAVAGEPGVACALEIYRREIDRVLALGGWDGVGRVGPGALAPPPRPGAG